MQRTLRVALITACLSLVAVAPAHASSYRDCSRVVNPYAGTRYEGVDLTGIRALRVSCTTARRVARGAHRRALGLTPSPDGTRTFSWDGWKVTADLSGSSDRYVARKGDRRVRWRF